MLAELEGLSWRVEPGTARLRNRLAFAPMLPTLTASLCRSPVGALHFSEELTEVLGQFGV
jgi:hypothetical protein